MNFPAIVPYPVTQTLSDRWDLATGTSSVSDASELQQTKDAMVLPVADEFLLTPLQMVNGRVRSALNGVADKFDLQGALPKGDGRTVMLLHGYGDDGIGLKFLRGELKKLDYSIEDPGYGRNVGNPYENYELAVAQLKKLAKNGRVTLVGHSHGGLMARRRAAEYPDLVEHVVRVASPAGGLDTAQRGARALLTATMTPENKRLLEQFSQETIKLPVSPKVKLTSISAAEDAVIDPSRTHDPAPQARLKRVPGSHIGVVLDWPLVKELAGEGGLLRESMRR
ncbi:MAG: lipase family alpha/beta hydrolase [Myxococcaceae bacterium]